MFDFVSTRVESGSETKSMARLMSAVIVRFIRDASLKPSSKEAELGRNIADDARAAIEYLFKAGSVFEEHIESMGGSAAPFRAALLDDRPLDDRASFTPMQRRVIQARYRWWLSDDLSALAPSPSESSQ